MRAHSGHWFSVFAGGNCRSQLCIDLRRRIEDGGDIRFEDDCDNRPRHARRKPIRLRLRIVKLVSGRTSTSRRSAEFEDRRFVLLVESGDVFMVSPQ